MIVAFADTSGEASAMAELVKNSLIVGPQPCWYSSAPVSFWPAGQSAPWRRPGSSRSSLWRRLPRAENPLTVILSNADMILSHPEEQPRRWAENIKAESVRMKHLTEELPP